MTQKPSEEVLGSLLLTFYCFLFLRTVSSNVILNTTTRVHVVVGLDQFGVWLGKMGMNRIAVVIPDFNDSSDLGYNNTRQILTLGDSMGDDTAASAALDLIKDVEAQAMIEPAYLMQRIFVMELGPEARIHTISVSSSGPSLSSIGSPCFSKPNQNDSSQIIINAITASFEAFGPRKDVLRFIYVDDEFVIVDALLHSSAFQFINVFGDSERDTAISVDLTFTGIYRERLGKLEDSAKTTKLSRFRDRERKIIRMKYHDYVALLEESHLETGNELAKEDKTKDAALCLQSSRDI